METVRKITVEVPAELLGKAQRASGSGITQTVRGRMDGQGRFSPVVNRSPPNERLLLTVTTKDIVDAGVGYRILRRHGDSAQDHRRGAGGASREGTTSQR